MILVRKLSFIVLTEKHNAILARKHDFVILLGLDFIVLIYMKNYTFFF